LRAVGSIRFSTANEERVRLEENGSIRLVLEGDTTSANARIDTSGDNLRLVTMKDGSGGCGFIMETQHGGSLSEKLRITTDGQFETNGVRNIYQSFQLVNNQNYNWDFTVPAEGSYGNSFYLVAGYNHYYETGYGAHRTVWFSARGTSVNAMGNGIEQYHSQSGSWTFSKPNSTTVRITKTAGTYGGAGYGFFHLMYNHF